MRLPRIRLRRMESSKDEPASASGEAKDQPAESGAKPQPTPAPRQSSDPHERIDGLRAWLAAVDRKLGVRSYAGGAAVVLALAAGIIGVVLALSAKDESATKGEVREVREQLVAVEQEASSAAEEEVNALTDRVEALEEQLSDANGDQTTLERELEVVQDDIDDLRTQISDLNQSGGGSGSGSSGP